MPRDVVLDALLDALALVSPIECAGCGRPDRDLCSCCRARLAPLVTRRGLRDGTPVITALLYESEVRAVVLALKEQGRTGLARALAPAMAAAIAAALTDPAPRDSPAVEIVAIPPTRASRSARGYDPLALVLRHARRRNLRSRIPHPRPSTVLTIARRTGRQKALGIAARAANRAGVLRARGPLDGRRFLVVDDVLTTGATLAEAVRALRAAGGIVVGAAAVAYTPRHLNGG